MPYLGKCDKVSLIKEKRQSFFEPTLFFFLWERGDGTRDGQGRERGAREKDKSSLEKNKQKDTAVDGLKYVRVFTYEVQSTILQSKV